MLTQNFKWHFYKNDPILRFNATFGSIFTVNTLKNHFFWPEIHFWGYFYVKNALSLEKCVILRKKCIFTPKIAGNPNYYWKNDPHPILGQNDPKMTLRPPFLGGHMTPPEGGSLGVKNGSKMTIFGSFFTIFSKKNPWISLLLFFKKKTLGFPYYFFSKKWPFFGHFWSFCHWETHHFLIFGQKNHWIW